MLVRGSQDFAWATPHKSWRCQRKTRPVRLPSLIAFAAGMARRHAEFFIVCAPRGARTCAEVHRTMPARLSTSNLRCQTVSLLLPDMHDRQLLCLSALLCFPFSATMTAVPVAVDCSAPLPRAWGQDWRVNKLELGKACT